METEESLSVNECTVCFGEFTKKLRTKHTCPYCSKSVCLTCLKRFILSCLSDPHCLHCKRAYTTEILDGAFSKNFRRSELRKHRIQVLMEQEKSLFPQTLAIIEREDAQSEYMRAFDIHSSLIQRLSPRDNTPIDVKLIEQINAMRHKISGLLERVNQLGGDLYKSKTVERKEFVRKCPSCPDGFLSTAWRCPLCKTKVCHSCLAIKKIISSDSEEKEDEHVCKDEDVASAKTIESETKPCPSCGVRVQKSEGCNQMWCTSCNNAFDWRTGKKVNGPIHNPHFHEYNRLQNQQAAHPQQNANQWVNACDNNNDPAYWPWLYGGTLVNYITTATGGLPLAQQWVSLIIEVNRLMIERSMSIQQYTPYLPSMYEDLRKKRLRGLIDDIDWARQLSARETKREKENKQRQLDELLLAVARDTFQSIIGAPQNTIKTWNLEVLLRRPLEASREYYNSQLEMFAKENDSKQLIIDNRWRFLVKPETSKT